MTRLEIKNNTEKTISYQGNIAEMSTEKIKFIISSTNIQNDIYFTDMVVNYRVK